jgi:hypothetical protein
LGADTASGDVDSSGKTDADISTFGAIHGARPPENRNAAVPAKGRPKESAYRGDQPTAPTAVLMPPAICVQMSARALPAVSIAVKRTSEQAQVDDSVFRFNMASLSSRRFIQ